MSAQDDSIMSSLIGASASSVTTVEDEVARLNQALVDLQYCGSASVALCHCPQSTIENRLIRELSQAARAQRFVSAHLSLDTYPVDGIDALVAAILDILVPPRESRAGGILKLLDLFYEKHKKHALEKFSQACALESATGDLYALCRAYLAAEDDAHREVRAFTLWAEGEALLGRRKVSGVRGVLDLHTGQRVFSELTRIIRALGHHGLVLVLSQGDCIAARSPRQREKSYTLLRELVDNFDSGRGAVSTRIVITGGDALFEGPTSLQSLPPLFARLSLPSAAEPPPPHRSWTSLVREPFVYKHRKIRPAEGSRPQALRSLIRISQGLPPLEAVTQMSVGQEKIDKSVDKLLHHADMAGSVFQVLSGEYGSGKTHILLHLAERALASGHPVFWFNLERMNLDLGNPARHLHRILEQSILPQRGRPSALDRLAFWTRSPSKLRALLQALDTIAQTPSEESKAAKKALALCAQQEDVGAVLDDFLSARDLKEKPGSSGYRLDAYRRLLLWVELLRLLEKIKGPVLLIDEAENLYTSGVPEAARRSALRSLAFYCGGALPGACVLLAMTPPALTALRKESKTLLREAAELGSTLTLEDVDLFRRRLHKLSPDEVPQFSRPMRKELARRIRLTHKSVRGAVKMENWDTLVNDVLRDAPQPRLIMRRLVDELEASWWGGN